MPRSVSRLVGSGFLAALVLPAPATACTCTTPPPSTSFAQSDAVFAGTILEWEDDGENVLARFFVTESWKAVTTRKVYVSTANNTAACGFPFEPGKKYVVFANDTGLSLPGIGPVFETWLCTQTDLYEFADAQLAFLDQQSQVTPALPSTWGGIKTRFRPERP